MLDTLSVWAWRYITMILPFALLGFIIQTRPEGVVACGAVMAFYASVGNVLYTFSGDLDDDSTT